MKRPHKVFNREIPFDLNNRQEYILLVFVVRAQHLKAGRQSSDVPSRQHPAVPQGEKTMQKLSTAFMNVTHEILSEYSFSPERDPGLERRLFRIICLTLSLLIFFVLIPANVLQGIPHMVNAPIALFGGVSLTLYRAARKGNNHVWTLLVIMLATINITWFLNGGNDGSVPYFLPPVCMYPLIIFRGWKRWLVTTAIVANGCLLIALSHAFPWLVIPYISAFARTMDLIVGMIIGSLSIILVLWVVLNTYLREQDRLKVLNLKLEREIDGRMRTENDLLRSNKNLAATEEKLRRQLDETITAQDALQRSEERYRQLVEHVNCIILRMTPSGEITYVNEFAEMFFGYDREELIGRNIDGLMDPETVAGGLHAIHPQPSWSPSDPCRSFEGEIVGRDGRRAWIGWSTQPISTCTGEISEILCVGQDVTERRQLQQQVMQRQKLESIGLLAGGIAHDFNNLLTPIMGASELLISAALHGDPVHRRAVTIRDAAGKAAELVKQILSFSSRQAVDTAWHDLNEIIDSFMVILRRTIREDIEIRCNPCAAECPLLVNRTQIEQILLNLAVNAQDAIDGTGVINIETGHMAPQGGPLVLDPQAGAGSFIVLTFGDDGCGMDDAVAGQIFDPFFTTKPVGRGTGLGLSTVYGIVKQHGGHIEVESRQGRGTIFRIFLPEAAARETAGKQPATPCRPELVSSGTVLLVEDNPMVLEIARELLDSLGLVVMAADTPESALSQARKRSRPIDLLVSDVVMPQMNGPELYKQLLQLQPDVKVLFMSGYAEQDILFGNDSGQPFKFIAKPFSANSFLSSVNQLMTAPA